MNSENLSNKKIVEKMSKNPIENSIFLLNLFNDDKTRERLLEPKTGILDIFYNTQRDRIRRLDPVKPIPDESYDKEITEFKIKCDNPSIFLKSRDYLKQTPEFNEIISWENEKTDINEYDDLNLVLRLDNLYKSKILDKISFEQFNVDSYKNMVYTLPENTILYRGVFSNKPIQGNYTKENKTGLIWLTPNINEAVRYSLRLYGIKEDNPRTNFRCEIYRYTTTEPLNLLFINKDNIERLKHDYPVVKKVVELIFPIKDGILNRNSMMFQDYIFSYFLCNYLHMDGYFSDKINRLNGEIMICKPKLNIEKLYIIKGETVIKWLTDFKVFDKKLIDYKIRMRSFLYFYAFNIDTSIFE